MMNDYYWGINEVAAELDLSTRQVRRLIKSGKLDAIKVQVTHEVTVEEIRINSTSVIKLKAMQRRKYSHYE